MYFLKFLPTSLGVYLLLLSACSPGKENLYRNTQNYRPDDQALYDTIVKLDSRFFHAYNTCDVNLDEYASYYSENIEFYHDKGGLMTVKQDIIDATKRNVCGKVTRELVPGSIEVYPIKNFGAIEIGLHLFRNKADPPGTRSSAGRFMVVWKQEKDGWKITRVVSLH